MSVVGRINNRLIMVPILPKIYENKDTILECGDNFYIIFIQKKL